MHRKWFVLIAVSLMFFFIFGTTFSSMGVALYPMIRDLHWSQTQAGGSFSVLGLACCLSSLVPMALVNVIGARGTMFLGGLLFATGFLVASFTEGLVQFLVAAGLLGVGFSLSANILGVYLLARWFPGAGSGRIIGIYLMSGAFGGVAGPPLAQAIIGAAGWRVYWLVLAVCAALLGLLRLLLIRDQAPASPEAAEDAGGAAGGGPDWKYRDAVFTPQFAILAFSMVLTEACVTILHSAGVIHFAKLGLPTAFGALMLSLQALMATLAKGGAGLIGGWIDQRLVLAGGLCLQGVGFALLAFAHSQPLAYAFAVCFGVGWGAAYLSITVLLLDYFGPRTGSAVLSLVWLMTALSSLGPAGAGLVADQFGTFAPAFEVSGALFIPMALAVMVMRRPRKRAEARAAARAVTPGAVEPVSELG
ncbi:MAG: MFS transporter [Caulobacteraceae bacterium]|nr:MFS transporter [Caulobacteraceae bacterium]